MNEKSHCLGVIFVSRAGVKQKAPEELIFEGFTTQPLYRRPG
jgi:hypothetical protein